MIRSIRFIIVICLAILASAEATVIEIPDDYPSIQTGVDSSAAGDTLFIHNGTYREWIVIHKSLTIIGNDRDSVFVEADTANYNDLLSTIVFFASKLNLKNITVRNTPADPEEPYYAAITVGYDSCYIESCNVANNQASGIKVYGSHNAIRNNLLSSNGNAGVYIEEYTRDNLVSENTFTSNARGCVFLRTKDSRFEDNLFFENSIDFLIIEAESCVVANNTFMQKGIEISGSRHNAFSGNFLGGRPIAYFEDVYDDIVPTDQGQVILVGCEGVTVANQEISGPSMGIQVHYSRNCIIAMNNVSNARYGIILEISNGNEVRENNVRESIQAIELFTVDSCTVLNNHVTHNVEGIVLLNANNNYVQGNIADSCYGNGIGIAMDGSYNNIVCANYTAYNSWYGIGVSYDCSSNVIDSNIVAGNSWCGIYAGQQSFYNTFSRNLISNTGGYGVWLSTSSRQTTVSGNIITGNDIGIYMYTRNQVTENAIVFNNIGIYIPSGSENTIYHNDFIGNAVNNALDSARNIWYQPAPVGGNYWDDYSGADNDHDGFGDTPYLIPGDGARDNLPLMMPTIEFTAGDVNRDRIVNGLDVVFMVNYFRGRGPAPQPLITGDMNGNCRVNGADVAYLVCFLQGECDSPQPGDCYRSGLGIISK